MTTLTRQAPPTGDVLGTHVLHDLRGLVPPRHLSHLERLHLAERQAAALRQSLGITTDRFPVRLLRQIPRIQVRTVDDLPVSGITFWGDHTWKIHVRAAESLAHQRFTVLHEFKHILDHPACGALYDERAYVALGERELVADHFAACALLPAENLKAAYATGSDRRDLARRFGVNGRHLALRLAELGLEPHLNTHVTERRIT